MTSVPWQVQRELVTMRQRGLRTEAERQRTWRDARRVAREVRRAHRETARFERAAVRMGVRVQREIARARHAASTAHPETT